MGLSKKLGQLNTNANTQSQYASQPLAQGGYNSNNIQNLPVAQPLNDNEKAHLKKLESEAYTDYSTNYVPTNLNGLAKPFVPSGPEYPCGEISSLVVEKMWRIVCLKGLYSFYTQGELQNLVNRACKHDYRILQTQWGLPTLDMTTDLAVLGLYDIIIFADDSGSMSITEPNEDNMSRFDIMKNVIGTIGFWSTLMDSDGIVVRFFNSSIEANGIGNIQDVSKLFNQTRPNGGTPMGRNLKSKLFEKIIYPVAQANELARPVLIITITDGIPDSKSDVVNTIKEIKNYFSKTKYGPNGVAFSFAQIGSDAGATSYLDELDTDPQVGNIIDCTSEFSIEQRQCGQGFTEAVWVIKLMIGPIDPTYDQADEQKNSSAPPSYFASLWNPSINQTSQNIPTAQAYPISGYSTNPDSNSNVNLNANPTSIFNFGLNK